jgi:hypothetical protein
MDRQEIEKTKRRADQLVESYGVFRIAAKLEEAVEHIAGLWNIEPIDVEILRPGKSIGMSNAIKAATSIVGGSSKKAVAGFAAGHVAEVAKTAGDVAAKTAAATGKIAAARTAAGAAAKTGLQAVKGNPYASAAAGVTVAVAGIGSGYVLKRELRAFNESCYRLRLETMLRDEQV